MSEEQIRNRLERLVQSFVDEPGDWDDVVARAGPTARRPRPGRRVGWVVLAGAVAAALLAVPSFGLGGRLAELVSRDDRQLKLPRQADASRVLVVLEPRSGEVVVRAAPMRTRPGICYVLRTETSGCSLRSKRGYLVGGSGFPIGYTFERRVVAADARLASGRLVPLGFRWLPAPVDAAFFFDRRSSGRPATALLLRDRAGTVVHRISLLAPRPDKTK